MAFISSWVHIPGPAAVNTQTKTNGGKPSFSQGSSWHTLTVVAW
jgi:hypothetical protein